MRDTRKLFLRSLLTVSLAVAGLVAANPAKAQATDFVTMNFASGATFSGIVTFAPGYSYPEAVTGTLTGYQYGTTGYTGSGSDAIDWVWAVPNNFSSTPGVFSTYLMDGLPDNYTAGVPGWTNFIDFTYTYSGAPTLTFDNNPADGIPGYVNNAVDSADLFVSGSFTPVSSVPEGGASLLYLLLAAAVSFGAMLFVSRGGFGSSIQA